MKELRRTRSLCPVCLRLIDAAYVSAGALGDAESGVALRKICPEHGEFSVPIWRASQDGPDFARWARSKTPSFPAHPGTGIVRGCPYDCGLCPEHGQHTCTGLIEVTQRCNMRCPVCYASAGEKNLPPDPLLTELQARLEALYRQSGSCNVQFSGGEPTLRDDLPVLIAHARRLGFGLVQVNSNGLRLAREEGYARLLREAGADSIYLQWDSVREEALLALRGRACLEEKRAALRACTAAGLGVVLVATVVRGINDDSLGDLLRLGVEAGSTVRGLHLQPAAFFGRFPWELRTAPRLTLPEIMTLLAAQAPQWVKVEHFHPPGCEHELCSCSALYRRASTPSGAGLVWLSGTEQCCGAVPITPASPDQTIPTAMEGARKARGFIATHWSGQHAAAATADDFGRFVEQAGIEQRFTLSAMAFQDALSLDVARVRGCCIHVVREGGRMIPFCLHNMTSEEGVPLYPKA